MIDSELIITYTTGLYRTDPENSPRYDEFRDMFSEGQLRSKFWLVEELKKTGLTFNQCIIVGSWFGTLAFFLSKEFTHLKIRCLDIDPRCTAFLKNLTRYSRHENSITGIVGDMHDYNYDEDLVINTSCEHMDNIDFWLEKVPPKTVVVLQSSDLKNHDQHINCVNSLDEFKDGVVSHLEIVFAGELKLERYSRFMIVGTKKVR